MRCLLIEGAARHHGPARQPPHRAGLGMAALETAGPASSHAAISADQPTAAGGRRATRRGLKTRAGVSEPPAARVELTRPLRRCAGFVRRIPRFLTLPSSRETIHPNLRSLAKLGLAVRLNRPRRQDAIFMNSPTDYTDEHDDEFLRCAGFRRRSVNILFICDNLCHLWRNRISWRHGGSIQDIVP